MPQAPAGTTNPASEGNPELRQDLQPATRAAVRLLGSIGAGMPAVGSLGGIPWEVFNVDPLAGILSKVAEPPFSEAWFGLENGGWVRDAFFITGLKRWEDGALLGPLGHARFSPSTALREACKDRPNRLRFYNSEFHISPRLGRGLVDRVNEEGWTLREVLLEKKRTSIPDDTCAPQEERPRPSGRGRI